MVWQNLRLPECFFLLTRLMLVPKLPKSVDVDWIQLSGTIEDVGVVLFADSCTLVLNVRVSVHVVRRLLTAAIATSFWLWQPGHGRIVTYVTRATACSAS